MGYTLFTRKSVKDVRFLVPSQKMMIHDSHSEFISRLIWITTVNNENMFTYYSIHIDSMKKYKTRNRKSKKRTNKTQKAGVAPPNQRSRYEVKIMLEIIQFLCS